MSDAMSHASACAESRLEAARKKYGHMSAEELDAIGDKTCADYKDKRQALAGLQAEVRALADELDLLTTYLVDRLNNPEPHTP